MTEQYENFDDVASLVDRVLESLGISAQIGQLRAMERWPEAAGEKIAAKSKPVKAQGGVLWLQAAGPQWAAEISMRKSDILERLNELAGSEMFTDIRFVGAWRGRRAVR